MVIGEIVNSKWVDDKVVIFIQFVEGFKFLYILVEFCGEDRKLYFKQDFMNFKGFEDFCDLV